MAITFSPQATFAFPPITHSTVTAAETPKDELALFFDLRKAFQQSFLAQVAAKYGSTNLSENERDNFKLNMKISPDIYAKAEAYAEARGTDVKSGIIDAAKVFADIWIDRSNIYRWVKEPDAQGKGLLEIS